MLLDVDLATDTITTGPGIKDAVKTLAFKLATSAEISVRFWSAGVQVELAEGSTGAFGIKPAGQYDGDLLVSDNAWTLTGSGATALYTFAPDFNTEPLAALLASGDDNPNNDEASITAMLEIKWLAAGKTHRTQTVNAIIDNDVLKDTDGTPLALPTPDEWLEARRPAPLALTIPPTQGILGVYQLEFTSIYAIGTGTIDLAITSSYVNGGTTLTIHPAIENGYTDAQIRAAVQAALAANEEVAKAWTLADDGGAMLYLTRTGNVDNDGGEATFLITDPNEIIAFGIPIYNSNIVAPVTSNAVATALGQQLIVTALGGNTAPKIERDVFTCVRVIPTTWSPPGNVFYDSNTNQWYRQAILPGSPGAIDFGYAYD